MTTIKDIAKKAGVSVATVSRVINNKSDVSPSMREKIKNIMDELGYIPNSMAKNLSHRKSKLIAVILPTLNNSFFSELLTEIEKEANKYGYNTMHVISSDERKKVEYHLNSIRSNFVSGVIINSLHVIEKDLEMLERSGIKVLTIDRSFYNHKFSSVNVDNKRGGYLAAEHLIQKGCRNIIIISGSSEDCVLNDRLGGFKEFISLNNYEVNLTIYNSDLTSNGGFKTFNSLLSKKVNFDGVFCLNDAMALGVIRSCTDFGVNLPGDALIMGYDNSYMNHFSVPRLSSIDQRVSQFGEKSVRTVIELINSESDNRKVTIEPKLVERESTSNRITF